MVKSCGPHCCRISLQHGRENERNVAFHLSASNMVWLESSSPAMLSTAAIIARASSRSGGRRKAAHDRLHKGEKMVAMHGGGTVTIAAER
ncbi:hypothetical protein SESBI_46570 [Sesbania bispinosa]|nr:hypothetical protein SESBI_46570 [Sesbania bispinosa]